MTGVYVDFLLICAGFEQYVLYNFIRGFLVNACRRLGTVAIEIYWLFVEGSPSFVVSGDSKSPYIRLSVLPQWVELFDAWFTDNVSRLQQYLC